MSQTPRLPRWLHRPLAAACVLTFILPHLGLAASPPTPSFAVDLQITLSSAAAAKLASLHEGIIASASYAGDPTAAAERHANQIGQINLGSEQVSAGSQAGPVRLTGRKVFRSRLTWISGPVMLNINVFSARRSGPDNILDCDFFDGTLASAQRGPIHLNCSLISEHSPTRAVS